MLVACVNVPFLTAGSGPRRGGITSRNRLRHRHRASHSSPTRSRRSSTASSPSCWPRPPGRFRPGSRSTASATLPPQVLARVVAD